MPDFELVVDLLGLNILPADLLGAPLTKNLSNHVLAADEVLCYLFAHIDVLPADKLSVLKSYTDATKYAFPD